MSPEVVAIADRFDATVPQIIFHAARALGMLPLTGTCDETHIKEDLACTDIELAPADIAAIEQIGL